MSSNKGAMLIHIRTCFLIKVKVLEFILAGSGRCTQKSLIHQKERGSQLSFPGAAVRAQESSSLETTDGASNGGRSVFPAGGVVWCQDVVFNANKSMLPTVKASGAES